MRALSIRQPWAELILQGKKTIEYRSRATRIIGEEFYIYAAKGGVKKSEYRMSKFEGNPNGQIRMSKDPLTLPSGGGRGALPTGVLVGTAVITKCVRHNGEYHWYLAEAKRLPRPRKPRRMPQPVWFNPF